MPRIAELDEVLLDAAAAASEASGESAAAAAAAAELPGAERLMRWASGLL